MVPVLGTEIGSMEPSLRGAAALHGDVAALRFIREASARPAAAGRTSFRKPLVCGETARPSRRRARAGRSKQPVRLNVDETPPRCHHVDVVQAMTDSDADAAQDT